MTDLARYRRRAGTPIIAVRLDLDTDGFTYEKWGSRQTCKRGDWLVQNGDETYTVDADSFARTYRRVGPGQYEKSGVVWAEQADADGVISTKEGQTAYSAGSWLVYNEPGRTDGYAVTAERFAEMYELDA